MAESEGTHKLIPPEETEMTEQQTSSNLDEEFSEMQLDEDFWGKVCTEYGMYCACFVCVVFFGIE